LFVAEDVPGVLAVVMPVLVGALEAVFALVTVLLLLVAPVLTAAPTFAGVLVATGFGLVDDLGDGLIGPAVSCLFTFWVGFALVGSPKDGASMLTKQQSKGTIDKSLIFLRQDQQLQLEHSVSHLEALNNVA
jgi:hypothetical protein